MINSNANTIIFAVNAVYITFVIFVLTIAWNEMTILRSRVCTLQTALAISQRRTQRATAYDIAGFCSCHQCIHCPMYVTGECIFKLDRPRDWPMDKIQQTFSGEINGLSGNFHSDPTRCQRAFIHAERDHSVSIKEPFGKVEDHGFYPNQPVPLGKTGIATGESEPYCDGGTSSPGPTESKTGNTFGNSHLPGSSNRP